jgi:redox-sensitive bicupin YhaK (pirin superfamily)
MFQLAVFVIVLTKGILFCNYWCLFSFGQHISYSLKCTNKSRMNQLQTLFSNKIFGLNQHMLSVSDGCASCQDEENQMATTMNAQVRELKTIISGVPVTDGDGVKITRLIGTSELNTLDPFLLFDAFESDQRQDYIGGFPDHPHRGFETVTYLLAGRLRHKDSAGHEGVIEAGGVQWMTAGKGIVHSEMPEMKDGLLHGFQLWVNLPASKKMQTPAYQEFSVNEIALESLDNGTKVSVIAGTTDNGTTGPVVNHYVNPIYLDVTLPAGQLFEQLVDTDDNVFIFVIEGELAIGDSFGKISVCQMGVLNQGDQVIVTASEDTRFLLVAARVLKEPIARAGPFVMNTREEVLQAFDDFQNNRF